MPRLGRYRILEDLGEGGMGRVFLAQRDGSRDVCVVKQVRPEISGNANAEARFLREAQVAANLDHPNIARLIAAGREGADFCIGFEFIAGCDLDALRKRCAELGALVPYAAALAIADQVLETLAYVHRAQGTDGEELGLVHRDLSPRNIMVGFDGVVKLIDFGVARASVGEFRTRPGAIVGTPRYLSPEQAGGEDVDARSDLYSFAVSLYELLTGSALVTDGELLLVLRQVLFDRAPPAHQVNQQLPDQLSRVLDRALAKDPGERFQDAASFKVALRDAWPELDPMSHGELGALVGGHFAERIEWARRHREEARVHWEASGPSTEGQVLTATGVRVPAEPTEVDSSPRRSESPRLDPTRVIAPSRTRAVLAPGVIALAAALAFAAAFLSRTDPPPPARASGAPAIGAVPGPAPAEVEVEVEARPSAPPASPLSRRQKIRGAAEATVGPPDAPSAIPPATTSRRAQIARSIERLRETPDNATLLFQIAKELHALGGGAEEVEAKLARVSLVPLDERAALLRETLALIPGEP